MKRNGLVTVSLCGTLAVTILFSGCNRSEDVSAKTIPPLAPAARENNPVRADSGQQSYADVVARVAPAVVTIRSARRVRAPRQFPFLDDPLLRQFFGDRAPQTPRGGQVQRSLGSGVIVRTDGFIVTNHHVVDGAQEIMVELQDRKTVRATLVGSDAPSDLAVLRVNQNDLPTLTLGNSDQVRVGDIALAVGNPLGVGETVTAGIISAKGRSTGLSDGSFEDFLQTDAPINQGNSGGALVNTRGELIGINSQILSPTGGNIGIGFAIPSNMARNVMDQLISHGNVRRGQLGVGIQPVTADIAASLKLSTASGVLINSVTPGSPADRAGVKRGDIVTGLNGKPVVDSNTFRNQIAGAQPGSEVNLTLMRGGREQQVKVKLGEVQVEKAQADMPAGTVPSAGEGGQLGLSAQPLTPDIARELRLSGDSAGLVVRGVDPSGPAGEAGIQAGDVILEVNGQAIRSAADVKQALASAKDRPALLLINRGGQTAYLTVRTPA